MGQLIEVDFLAGEVLEGVDEYDRDFTRHVEDLHECLRQGVTFPELTAKDKDFLRALGGAR